MAGISSAVRSGETSNVRCADLRRLSLRKEDAIPDAKHPGKARKILRGKARSPPQDFSCFLGPEAHKLSVTPAKLAEAVFSSKPAISPIGVQGPWPLVQVHEGRRGPRPVVPFETLFYPLENGCYSSKTQFTKGKEDQREPERAYCPYIQVMNGFSRFRAGR